MRNNSYTVNPEDFGYSAAGEYFTVKLSFTPKVLSFLFIVYGRPCQHDGLQNLVLGSYQCMAEKLQLPTFNGCKQFSILGRTT